VRPNQIFRARQIAPSKGFDITANALTAGTNIQAARDQRNAPMSKLYEMLGRLRHADDMVGENGVDLQRNIAIEQHGGNSEPLQALQRPNVLLAVDCHDEAVGAAVLKHIDGVGFLAGFAIGVYEVERKAALAHFRVRGFEGRRMERIGDIVDDESDGERISAAHVLRSRIWLEAKRLDCGANLSEGRRTN
jgi:hypothetical protein